MEKLELTLTEVKAQTLRMEASMEGYTVAADVNIAGGQITNINAGLVTTATQTVATFYTQGEIKTVTFTTADADEQAVMTLIGAFIAAANEL